MSVPCGTAYRRIHDRASRFTRKYRNRLWIVLTCTLGWTQCQDIFYSMIKFFVLSPRCALSWMPIPPRAGGGRQRCRPHYGVICPKPQKGIFHRMHIFEPFDTYMVVRMEGATFPMSFLTACRLSAARHGREEFCCIDRVKQTISAICGHYDCGHQGDFHVSFVRQISGIYLIGDM